MAGLPPLLGFVAKEAALEALVTGWRPDGDGTGHACRPPAVLLVAVVVVGSVLTVAYSLRFWWGAFADQAPCVPHPPTVMHAPAAGFVAGPALLGVACLVAGFLGGPRHRRCSTPYAVAPSRSGAHPHALALWHGFTLAAGAVGGRPRPSAPSLFWQRERVARLQAHLPAGRRRRRVLPRAPCARSTCSRVEVTARTQRGSLAVLPRR